MIAMLLGAALIAANHDKPLTTTESWVLDERADQCAMAQHFGGTHNGILLGIRQRVAARDAMIVVERPAHHAVTSRNGIVTLTIDGQPADSRFQAWKEYNTGTEIMRFSIDQDQFARLRNARGLEIATDDGVRIDLEPSQMNAAFVMLHGCGDRLLRKVGVDPAIEAQVRTPPERADTGPWIKSADYPEAARKAGKYGISLLMWAIDTQGNIKNCRTITSSGTPLLDETACKLIQERGRYRPALDAAGSPVISHDSAAIIWFMEFRSGMMGPAIGSPVHTGD